MMVASIVPLRLAAMVRPGPGIPTGAKRTCHSAPTNRRRRPARTIGSVDATITDADAAQRYEARLQGDLAGFLDYVVKRERIALIHTEVVPAYQGRGAGYQGRFRFCFRSRDGPACLAH